MLRQSSEYLNFLVSVVVLLMIWLPALGDCFASIPGAALHHRTDSGTKLSRTVLLAETNGEESNKKERLVFSAEIQTTSEPLDTRDPNVVCNFVSSRICRDHFLSAGGTSKLSDEVMKPELKQFWIDLCDEGTYGAECLPQDGDSLVASEATVHFPGLRMENTVCSGVKMLNDSAFPGYLAVMIGDKQRAFGPAPLVWLYNKMTGNDKKSKENYNWPSGTAKTRITVLETGENQYCLSVESRVNIVVEFPRLLVKLLPTSKEKMEQQGGAAVQKAVSKDILKCVDSVDTAFQKWQATKNVAAVE